jgi:nitrite reductase (NADH) large subunit
MAVVNDPEKRRFFQQFAITDTPEPSVEFVTERGQRRPADWPRDFVPLDHLARPQAPAANPRADYAPARWVRAGRVDDFPIGGGRAVKHGAAQIAVFRFTSRGQWYACENRCPHRREMVLARGILGDQQGTPKVACPLHKKTFSLESGKCLSGDQYQLRVFPVKVEADQVFLELPPDGELEASVQVESYCTPCAIPCG